MQSQNYVVGIDLGTTHTVVAFASTDTHHQDIQLFQIEQLIAPGQVSERPLLPSVRYHPALEELNNNEINFLSYNKGGDFSEMPVVLGEAARLLGAKSKGRFVTSAKSWLSHPGVDHTANILPWGSNEDVAKVSPIEASASYLAHIRTVWGHKFPQSPLEYQDIVITVPASFDEEARSLTLAAAEMAGLKKVRLLEEPQAVCYDWLRINAANLKQTLNDVHLLLVCDVGGGTTDLTLIKVETGAQEPKLTRIGVGDHLMLGGDNIDLALAHLAESRLVDKQKRLSQADLSQLLEQCRLAKEHLLATDAPEQTTVTLLGGGSKLIGSSRSVVFTKEEVRTLALDGFFPLSMQSELPNIKRSGVVEFGLPYASDPAISKHIAGFLKHHSHASLEAMKGEGSVPDALLLNGGVFRSHLISSRLKSLLDSWGNKPTTLLENKHPELSVAYGALSYALAKRNNKLKIGGGAARSYFLVLDSAQTDAPQGVCILPKGSEEGDEVILKDRQFSLRLGVPVRFHLASTTGDLEFKAGDITPLTDDFNFLPPLAVAFETSAENAMTEVIVKLAVTQTEMGVLKIECVSVENSQQRWNVEFQLRKKSATDMSAKDFSLPAQFGAAVVRIQAIFGSKSKYIEANAVKNLRAELEKQLGADRYEWQLPLLRALFSALIDNTKSNRRSEQHERVWLSLVGFCLRPGLGDSLDDWRVDQLWKHYAHGIQYVNETQNWTEWWTLWRRIAGGLSVAAQEQIFADISKYINPSAARQAGVAKQIKIRSYDDIVRLAAVLERLPVDKKQQLGDWLLSRLEKSAEPKQSWWAVGRIGARVPFYGSQHNLISAKVAEQWLAQILTEDWKKNLHAAFAATLIARMSGDRDQDIDSDMREQIITKLKLSKAPVTWIEMVEQYKELDEKAEKQMFGEALPPGLKLLDFTN
ncbi:MAG: hsp70 family protein [Methylococcales bacterium]|nr:hsp70 family protein [Methylococcales bacterium]